MAPAMVRIGISPNVNTASLSANAITATAIAADAITEAKIADDAIAAEHIATGAIVAATFAAGAIDAAAVADGAIDAATFAAGAIDAAAIAADAIGASELAADAATEIANAVLAVAMVEPSAVPAVTATLKEAISWFLAKDINKMTQTATTTTLRNAADDADIGASTVSDNGTTFVRGAFS